MSLNNFHAKSFFLFDGISATHITQMGKVSLGVREEKISHELILLQERETRFESIFLLRVSCFF